MRLAGKIAAITGGAGGIGLAIARRYAAEGAHAVILDLLEENGEREAAAIREAGGRATFLTLDAADEAAVNATIAQIEASIGPIDILVCSAGISGAPGPFYKTDKAEFERTLRINLIGPFLIGKAVAARMVEAKRKGSIINISSVGGQLGVAESWPYCTSKAGLDMLTKTMALALAPHGIRVNAIGPGPTESPMTAHLPEAARDTMISRTPLGRFGTTEEMAGVALFLATDDAGFVTGQTIYADGGRLALNYVMPKP
ncbi:SDR family NAD(P)-dependent oxidoreductase [Terricaulis silvestris]|uniref:D-xylose 1-dehydrogenase n=1 Tax=Terricaulis silvestris TaxID=2686094 RepID=A0A6I6MTR3_9CAUL|nr:SDR family oxidoreductase [Terricaulis silvestris]QGZ96167.1 3-oxoacyl-[acyl-carrier-protein] reductase FabG [Terricaulis silvestris]